MQIVETSNEGLKRAYSVTIPAKEIAARIEGEIAKIAPQVRMPGFRPGKVPANLVRKMHGPALHQEALNTTVREAMDQLLVEHKLRPAMQPEVALGEGYEEGKDAQLSVSVEVLPAITVPSFDGLKLEKLVVEADEAEVDEQVTRLASGAKSFTDAKKGKKAETGDQLIIDFVGKLDGVEFEGGKAEDAALEIGSGRFIPGFEEQLVGAKVGDEKTITVTFPADYPAENLKGKDATFDITVKAVKVAGETKIDDDFAKNLGLESLDQLKGLLRGQIEQELAGLTRTQMKRALLDQLAAGHDFDVPPSMVEAEFGQIWAQLQQEAQNEEDPAAAMAEIEAEKDDYRGIAIRRVRLGLLLSEIGQANGVEVTGQEMNMLIQQAAMQYRAEDRERFVQYIQSEPMAAAQLRAAGRALHRVPGAARLAGAAAHAAEAVPGAPMLLRQPSSWICKRSACRPSQAYQRPGGRLAGAWWSPSHLPACLSGCSLVPPTLEHCLWYASPCQQVLACPGHAGRWPLACVWWPTARP